MFGRAVAERRIVVERRLPERPVLRPLRGRRPARPDARDPLVHRRADDRRRPVFGAMGTYTPRVGAFGEAEIALVKALADHAALGDRQRRADRPAGRLPGGGRAAGRDRAGPARDRRPDHRPARPRRGPPARRRRGGRPARRRRRPDRPARASATARLYWAYDATTGQAARSRPDRRHRRGEGRRGDLGPGRSRAAAGLHRRLPRTTTASSTPPRRTPTSGATRSAPSSRCPSSATAARSGRSPSTRATVDAFTEADARSARGARRARPRSR